MLTLKKHSHSQLRHIVDFVLKNKYLLLALLLSVVVFHQWFSASLFSYADGWYAYSVNLREYLHPSVWTTSAPFGGFEQNLWRIPMNMLIGIPGLLGWDYAQASNIVLLLPVVFLPVWSSYLLVKYLFNDEKAAFVGSLIFAFNTYFLSITTQGHMLLTLGFSIGVFGLYFIIRQYDTPKLKYLLTAILCLFACGFTDFRSLYLVVGVVAAYTLFVMVERRVQILNILKSFGLTIFGVGLLNAFWLLPAAMSGGGVTGGILSRPLFAPHFWTLRDAIALHHPFWNGADTTWFVSAVTPWYFWCIPALAIAAIVLWPKNRFIVFFGIVAIVGIFLSKSSNTPFGELYQWTFTHVPGFSAFREGTKFYFYTALAYAVLTAGLVTRLLNLSVTHRVYARITKLGAHAVVGGVMLITIAVTMPYVTNRMTGYMQPRAIASDYTILKSFLEAQPDYFRTFWLPTTSRWGLNTNIHPAINAVDIFGSPLQGLDAQYSNILTGTDMITAIKNGRLANILDTASVKYVVIPLDDPVNSDDFFHYYKTARSEYVAQLDRITRLKRVDIHTTSLAVYENATYQPHVSVSDTPYVASSIQNMGREYSFLRTNGNANPLFVNDTSGVQGAGTVRSLFSVPGIVRNGNRTYVQDNLYRAVSKTETLYKNIAARDISYSSSSSKVTVSSRGLNSPSVNGITPPFVDGGGIDLATANLRQRSTYLVLDNTATPILPNTTVNFGSSKLYSSAGIYETDKNLIANSSFDKGPWQPTVSDCNNYDNNPRLSQSTTVDNVLGSERHVLQLEATRHVACASTTFDVSSDTHALLNFDYRGLNTTQQAGFYIEFNDTKKTVLNERIVLDNDQWAHILRYVSVPSGATKATLYLYSYESDGTTNNIVRYTNIDFSTARLTAPITFPTTSDKFVGLPLNVAAGNNTVQYDMTTYKSRNLVTDPSFEHGTWQPKVGDCNNYDAQPKISQTININDFTRGTRSLQLEAAHHTACTFLSFPIDVRGSQLLSFDYQSPDSGQAGYFVSFNDPGQTSVNERLPTKNNSWQHFQKEIIAPVGATTATLYLYAYESDGVANNTVRYDNVSFMKIPGISNRFYLTSEPTAGFEAPAKVNFKMLNPGKYVVDIKGVKSNFLLHLGETYNQGWKLAVIPEPVNQSQCNTRTNGSAQGKTDIQECNDTTISNSYTSFGLLKAGQEPLSIARHIEVNGFSNGWLVDPVALQANHAATYYSKSGDGTVNFKVLLYYQPEAYLGVGIVVSSLCLIISIGLLIMTARRNSVSFTR